MIRLVVSSLENIIELDDKRQVGEDILDLIVRLKEQDIKFAVATAQNYDSVKDIFGRLKNDIIYICNDGGVVIYQDKVISKTPIDRLVCLGVADELGEDRSYKLMLSGERNAVLLKSNATFERRLKKNGINPEFVGSTQEMSGDITKITIFKDKGFTEADFSNFIEKWGNRANISATDETQLFVTGQYVSKGMALAVVQHLFDISEEDTVVFGAGFSDIDMFNHSYFSYAMMDSASQVRYSAQHIAESVNMIIEDILRM